MKPRHISLFAILLTGVVLIIIYVQQVPVQMTGNFLGKMDIEELANLFNDNPVTGGQVMPRNSLWVNENTFIFLQFDKGRAESNSTSLRYIGVGVKGVFCNETRPDAARGSFTHLHKYNGSLYGTSHASQPGDEGYWLTWIAVDNFTLQNRSIMPGVDYQFSLQQVPSCGQNVSQPMFKSVGAANLTSEKIGSLAAFFNDNPVTGGQVMPRNSLWVNENTFIFLQFDKGRAESNSTALRYFGIGVRGEFCKQTQPTTDFSHLHKYNASQYGLGHASTPGDKGYWLLWVSVDHFTLQNRSIDYGVDREFSLQTPPEC